VCVDAVWKRACAALESSACLVCKASLGNRMQVPVLQLQWQQRLQLVCTAARGTRSFFLENVLLQNVLATFLHLNHCYLASLPFALKLFDMKWMSEHGPHRVPTKATTSEVVLAPSGRRTRSATLYPSLTLSPESSPEHRVLHASSIIAFPCCRRARAQTHDLRSCLCRHMAHSIFRG
jgi:hypothetical protein